MTTAVGAARVSHLRTLDRLRFSHRNTLQSLSRPTGIGGLPSLSRWKAQAYRYPARLRFWWPVLTLVPPIGSILGSSSWQQRWEQSWVPISASGSDKRWA